MDLSLVLRYRQVKVDLEYNILLYFTKFSIIAREKVTRDAFLGADSRCVVWVLRPE